MGGFIDIFAHMSPAQLNEDYDPNPEEPDPQDAIINPNSEFMLSIAYGCYPTDSNDGPSPLDEGDSLDDLFTQGEKEKMRVRVDIEELIANVRRLITSFIIEKNRSSVRLAGLYSRYPTPMPRLIESAVQNHHITYKLYSEQLSKQRKRLYVLQNLSKFF